MRWITALNPFTEKEAASKALTRFSMLCMVLLKRGDARCKLINLSDTRK